MRRDRARDIADGEFCLPIDQISPIHVPQTPLRPIIADNSNPPIIPFFPSSLLQTVS